MGGREPFFKKKKMGFTPCKAKQPLCGIELQQKEAQKHYSIQEICLKSTYKVSVNSILQANKIIGQRKAFYRQRISEPSCVRKETVDIDVLVTSRNGDIKIMQSIRVMSRPPFRKRK